MYSNPSTKYTTISLLPCFNHLHHVLCILYIYIYIITRAHLFLLITVLSRHIVLHSIRHFISISSLITFSSDHYMIQSPHSHIIRNTQNLDTSVLSSYLTPLSQLNTRYQRTLIKNSSFTILFTSNNHLHYTVLL